MIVQPRNLLGAEELIELGQPQAAQAVQPSADLIPAPTPEAGELRYVRLTADEGKLLLQVVENIKDFAKDYFIEFHSYCPTERWQESLVKAGTWTHEIEKQLKAKKETVVVPAEAVFHLVDLEKCVSAARDARNDSAKLAFMFSAGGAIADVVFGLSWVAVPAYITGLAILFGRPLMARLNPEPEEPYKRALSGCTPAIGDHTDKRKILERVIVCPQRRLQTHWWGNVLPGVGSPEGAVCLVKDRFRVRVEGWAGDTVVAASGWTKAPMSECRARRQIAVWEPSGYTPRMTPFGRIPSTSGFNETFWVEYVGPLTGGMTRGAGPFG